MPVVSDNTRGSRHHLGKWYSPARCNPPSGFPYPRLQQSVSHSGYSARFLLGSSVLWHPLLGEGPFSFTAVPACMNPCKVAAGLGGKIRGRFRDGPQREGPEGRDDNWIA